MSAIALSTTGSFPSLEEVFKKEPDGLYGHLEVNLKEEHWSSDDLWGGSGVERSWQYSDDGEVVYTSARPLLSFEEWSAKHSPQYLAFRNANLLEEIKAQGGSSPLLCFDNPWGLYIEFLIPDDDRPVTIKSSELKEGIVALKIEERRELTRFVEAEKARREAATQAYWAWEKEEKLRKEAEEAPLVEFFSVLREADYQPLMQARLRGPSLISREIDADLADGKVRAWIADYRRDPIGHREYFEQGDLSPSALAQEVLGEFKPKLLPSGVEAPRLKKRTKIN